MYEKWRHPSSEVSIKRQIDNSSQTTEEYHAVKCLREEAVEIRGNKGSGLGQKIEHRKESRIEMLGK